MEPAIKRFNAAMRQLRSWGFFTRTNYRMCCGSCASAHIDRMHPEIAEEAKPMLWTLGAPQRNTAEDLASEDGVWVNHDNIDRVEYDRIAAAFVPRGFIVSWDGSQGRCINIRDAHRKVTA